MTKKKLDKLFDDKQAKEYLDRLDDIKKKEKEVTEAIKEDYQARQEAQQNWVNGAKDSIRKYQEEAMNVAQLTEDAFTRGFSKMEDALVEFAQTGKFNFGDFADFVIAEIARIQAKQAIANIFGNASGGGGLLSDIGSSIGDFFGSPSSFTNTGGQDFSSLAPTAGFANGGISNSAGVAMVSEGRFRNEAHVPLPDGKSIPVSLEGQTQGVVINQNINIDSRSDQNIILGAMNQAKEIAKAEILQSMRTGGEFAINTGRT